MVGNGDHNVGHCYMQHNKRKVIEKLLPNYNIILCVVIFLENARKNFEFDDVAAAKSKHAPGARLGPVSPRFVLAISQLCSVLGWLGVLWKHENDRLIGVQRPTVRGSAKCLVRTLVLQHVTGSLFRSYRSAHRWIWKKRNGANFKSHSRAVYWWFCHKPSRFAATIKFSWSMSLARTIHAIDRCTTKIE